MASISLGLNVLKMYMSKAYIIALYSCSVAGILNETDKSYKTTLVA